MTGCWRLRMADERFEDADPDPPLSIGDRQASISAGAACRSEQALLLLLLTLNTVARPRHRFEALRLDFLLASHAEAVRPVSDTIERVVDELEDAPIVAALEEQKLLGVCVEGLVCRILGSLLIGLAAFLLRLHHLPLQFVLLGQKPLPVSLHFLFVHEVPC